MEEKKKGRKKQAEKRKAKPKAAIDGVPVWCSFDTIVDVSELEPNPENPNQHPEEQVELLGEIIRGNGWRNPITVSKRSGLIVRGHCRYLSALRKGFKSAPVDLQDYETDEAEYADLLADNKISELSIIDEDMEAGLIRKLEENDFNIMLAGVIPIDQEIEEHKRIEDEKQEQTEIEFSRELLLEHNYIVLTFDNPFDWQVACDKFGLRKVKDLIVRKGQPVGIGRVLVGSEWLDRIR